MKKRVERKENKSLVEARKIKQLIESPERVWQAVDDGDILLATSEFLCARKNYAGFEENEKLFLALESKMVFDEESSASNTNGSDT